MAKVFVSLGSNIEREKNIPLALKALEKAFGPLTLSSVYESEAVGFEGAPFYNMIAVFETDLPVHEVAKKLREIEHRQGRDWHCTKFSSRTLDLDLILYGDLILKEDKLVLPRQDIERFAFVLEPLAEIVPHLRHPVKGESYHALWSAFDKSGLNQRRVKNPW